MDKVRIESGNVTLFAELNGSATARGIYDKLPLSGKASTWGDEIYFTIPLHWDEAPDARQEVEIGDLGFWPAGDAFCIFFGPTPVSNGVRPRAYSPVNVFGHILGDPEELKKVGNGDEIKVTKEI
jgi:hypothetical protein